MTYDRKILFKTPANAQTADFIIGGGMKCGTTTLHRILGKHPNVFMPNGETPFFNLGEIMQHADHHYYDHKNRIWHTTLMAQQPEKYWAWYSSCFNQAGNRLKGQDEPDILASQFGAENIAIQDKPIKMIFILRHPTERSYSQYYHMLRTQRVMFSFEDTLMYVPKIVIDRSLYLTQLKRFYQVMPKDRIKIILFEDLIKQPKETVHEVCTFLDIDPELFPKDVYQTHANPGRLPKFPQLQYYKSRIHRSLGNIQNSFFPEGNPSAFHKKPIFVKMMHKAHRAINPLVEKKPPKIRPETKLFLDEYFHYELYGLDELTGKDILSRWFK